MTHAFTISPTMLRVEALRQVRNPYTLAFTLAMPVGMYLLFGAGAAYGGMSAGHGNVRFYVMVSMAAYGAAVAMTSATSTAAVEAAQGWGRQLAMTPLRTAGYAATKLITALAAATLAVVLVFVVGAATGAEASDGWRWAASAVLVLGGALLFGLYGLGMGLVFRSDGAATLASISLTFFGFFGNVFMPLDGTMLDIARFTPMYGVVALARWPLTDGVLTTGQTDQPWGIALNIVVWLVVFAALVGVGVKRSRARR